MTSRRKNIGSTRQSFVRELSGFAASEAWGLWKQGYDTSQIADRLGQAEALVFNTIRARREQEREGRLPRGWAGERRVAGVAHG